LMIRLPPRVSLYGYVSIEQRLVLHNLTLGGSMFLDGPSQEMRPFVRDVQVGMAVALRSIFGMDFSVSYSAVERSREFNGQTEPSRFAAIMLSITEKM